MTDRGAHAWAAAIIAAGGLLGVTAALAAGRPDSLWRPFAIGLAAYIATGGLVLRWGLDVYGPPGALGAVALLAFAPSALGVLAAPPLLVPAGGTALAGGFAQLGASYALMRCLLDPTLQWALLAGVGILATTIGGFLHGSAAAVLTGVGILSAALVGVRIATAERCEPRARVVRSSLVSMAVAWTVGLAPVLLLRATEHLPTPEEYAQTGSAGRPNASTSAPVAGVDGATRGEARIRAVAGLGVADTPAPLARTSWWAALPLAALSLAAARPWRRLRRYTDAGWVAMLLCLGVPFWLGWGEPGGVFMAPTAALLAGGCWDRSRSALTRHAATAVVLVQLAFAVTLWANDPGGVRMDARLPLLGIPDAGGGSP